MTLPLSILFQGTTLLFISKIGVLVAIFFFIFFLIVVLRQIQSMNKLISDAGFFVALQVFSYLLISIAITLFLVSIVIL
ncbi:MAG TPA: DUF5657 family protein [Patescibacteria group bacterium]|nr:DUF5657 family protein [Patescibacteria group bacterium]